MEFFFSIGYFFFFSFLDRAEENLICVSVQSTVGLHEEEQCWVKKKAEKDIDTLNQGSSCSSGNLRSQCLILKSRPTIYPSIITVDIRRYKLQFICKPKFILNRTKDNIMQYLNIQDGNLSPYILYLLFSSAELHKLSFKRNTSF